VRQPLLNEILERHLSSIGRDRPVEFRQFSGVIGKFTLDQPQHFARNGIRCKRRRERQHPRALPAEAPTILCIVVPLAARRLPAIHKDTPALAHEAIEMLHARLLAIPQPGAKLTRRYEKTAALDDLQNQAGPRNRIRQRLLNPPVTCALHDNLPRPALFQQGSERRGQ